MDFEQFVSARLDALLRYATVLCCDPHLAQDVVQEVLLRAQVRWSRISAMGEPAAYVKKMVTNEYLAWRRRRARKEIAFSSLEPLGGSIDPMTGYDQRDAMWGGITQLPPKQRAAVVLRYYENCSYDEIASMLGCTAGTARSHISHAITALRAYENDPVRGRT